MRAIVAKLVSSVWSKVHQQDLLEGQQQMDHDGSIRQVEANRPVLPPGGGGGAGGDGSPIIRRHHHPHMDKRIKVVRLSELLSVVRLPPNAEACPMVGISSVILTFTYIIKG